MALRGPYFLRGVEGPGAIRSRRDKSEEQLLVTLGTRSAVKYSTENMSVAAQYFCPSYLNLSTPLAWNPTTKQYCCVLNDNKLIMWNGEENHLEKVSASNSHQLSGKAIDALATADECHIVFSNGSVQSVSYLLQKKKMPIEDDVLPSKAVIKQSKLFYRDNILYLLHWFNLENDSGRVESTVALFRVTVDPDTNQTRLFELNRFQFPDNAKSIQVGEGAKGFFITREGDLNSVDLSAKGERTVKKIIKLAKQSASRPIHMAAIGDSHVCVLGDEVDGDGSIVSVVNVVHGILVVNQTIKAVASSDESAGMVAAGDESHRLLFKHGQRVASILVEDLPSHLATLIGTQSTEVLELTSSDGLPAWEFVGALSQPIQLYQILPDLLVEQNVDKVAEIVETYSDIPELLVLNIIEMYLNAPNEKFGAKKSKKTSAESNERRRMELISRVLSLPITDSLMIQHLRQIEFSLGRKLLAFLFDLLDTDSQDENETHFEQMLLWIGVVLNAHYCNFVLSKDEDVREQLGTALSVISGLEASLHLIGTTLPLIKMITHKQLIRPAMSQKVYNIEILDL